LSSEDDSGTTGSQLAALVQTDPRFASVEIDTYDITSQGSAPTLAYLQGYSEVLVWTDVPVSDPTTGDNLKSYVDGGGKVLMAVYSNTLMFGLSGGITLPGYEPFELGAISGTSATQDSLDFSTANTADPFGACALNGLSSPVTYWENLNYPIVVLSPGATLIANDVNSEMPLIAINANRNVASFDTFPGGITPMFSFAGYSTNYLNLLTNLLYCLGNPAPPTTSCPNCPNVSVQHVCGSAENRVLEASSPSTCVKLTVVEDQC